MTMSTVSEDATSAASAGAGSNNNNVNKHDPVTPSGADIEHNVSINLAGSFFVIEIEIP